MNDELWKCDRWLERSGPAEAVVMSTRARLARNMPSVPFPRQAREVDLLSVLDRVSRAMETNPGLAGGPSFFMTHLAEHERQYLREAHLISAEMEKTPKHRALFLSPDVRQGVMVNEEDHLRIYALEAGFCPHEVLQQAIDLEKTLAREIPFAFSPQFGYLTACVTNTGTGLRVSALLHLPGLSIVGKMQELIEGLRSHGMIARGFYGEHTDNRGGFFQISNEATLGRSEQEIVEAFAGVVQEIIEREEEARQQLFSNPQLEDRVWRAYGILSYMRMVTSAEAMELLALLRLGVEMRIVRQITHADINKLAVLIQPSHIRSMLSASQEPPEGETFSEAQRDRARARLLRERLRGLG